MYHRILPATDPRYAAEEPGMVIQPASLQMHIRELRKHFVLMSLSNWVAERIAGNTLPPKACVITFDDGWLDNYEYAFPILQAEQAPATVFVVAEKVGTDFQFWPTIVAHLLVSGVYAPLQNTEPFGGVLAELSNVRQPTINREFIAEVIRRLKCYSDQAIFAGLETIQWRQLAGPIQPALMDWDQLRRLHGSGLVDVGSHTCSHQRLDQALTTTALEHEIVVSRQIIEGHIQAPANLFCYPNGDYSAGALALVEKTYQAAVTTRRGIASAGQPLHQLVRLGLHEEVSNTPSKFNARLSSWM
jgi:peptidoglycan/xylan/chitin deacetylase (PgdA/CDA1 family)